MNCLRPLWKGTIQLCGIPGGGPLGLHSGPVDLVWTVCLALVNHLLTLISHEAETPVTKNPDLYQTIFA